MFVDVPVQGWKGDQTRDIRFEAASVGQEYHSQAKLDALRQAVEDGTLTPRVAAVLPAENAAEGHRRLEAGGTRGRIVLTF
ncbi:MAG TPA: zinc-binding dehydrogenase [Jatrophihabitantaceae bacterium]|nr:zinc-binding dehydrogenase [Jatrophihabitantaceae bacterium]